jgi:hypothetical protein
VNWIYLIQDLDQWPCLVNTVRNWRIPYNSGYCLTGRTTVSFSRRNFYGNDLESEFRKKSTSGGVGIGDTVSVSSSACKRVSSSTNCSSSSGGGGGGGGASGSSRCVPTLVNDVTRNNYWSSRYAQQTEAPRQATCNCKAHRLNVPAPGARNCVPCSTNCRTLSDSAQVTCIASLYETPCCGDFTVSLL